MKVYTLHTEQIVQKSLDEVFKFFSRPENLAVITPASLEFVILTPSPIEMKPGALIIYTIRLIFTRVRWTSLITSYDPPVMFVDEQLKGPYAFWHHMHTFYESEGETLIVDDVRYAIPFSFVGRMLHALFIRRELKRIFSYRSLKIKEIFSGKQNGLNVADNIKFGEIKK